jgi:hypothetical protein
MLHQAVYAVRRVAKEKQAATCAPPTDKIGYAMITSILQDVTSYAGSWPQRVYLGMGGKEYSGVRRGRGREHDAHFPRYLKSLYASLTEQGLGPDRLSWTYDPTAAHTESAWAERLPEALAFVGQGWWDGWARKQGAAGQNMVTSPGQLRGGEEGQLLFFNRMASSTLARLPQVGWLV